MNAPHGPSEQELVVQTLKTAAGLKAASPRKCQQTPALAMLDPLNIDAVECNGQGSLLRSLAEGRSAEDARSTFSRGDAVEADSLLRAPLPLTAIKSRMGYATECAGIASLHRLVLSGMCGVLAPNNHLHQLNPHLGFDNKAALLTEPVETAMANSYMGVQSHGFGGTQVAEIRRPVTSGRGKWLDVAPEALASVALGNAEKTQKAIQAISSSFNGEKQSPMDDLQLMEFGSGDVGMPGDKYRIRLRIAGRYRALTEQEASREAFKWKCSASAQVMRLWC
eukprot:Skav212098  [mRNA]  locus=scaffold686:9837:17764:+ [translate_table: standard]